MILVDAGPLIALIDQRDPDHVRCRSLIQSVHTTLITTWPAFTEAMYFLGRNGWRSQEILWQLAERDDLQFAELTDPIWKRCLQLMRTYRNVPMDLADASIVAVAESRRLWRIFTLDDDFRVYRGRGGESFELVP